MPFPPPTHGHEEPPIGDTLHEYMIRKPGCTFVALLDEDFPAYHLAKGDLVVIEQGRNPHNGAVALVELDGERFLCELFYHKGIWYAKTADRRGKAPEGMQIVGIVTKSAKNQLR